MGRRAAVPEAAAAQGARAGAAHPADHPRRAQQAQAPRHDPHTALHHAAAAQRDGRRHDDGGRPRHEGAPVALGAAGYRARPQHRQLSGGCG
eukprot:2726688-Prymnesium_polylepis.1